MLYKQILNYYEKNKGSKSLKIEDFIFTLETEIEPSERSRYEDNPVKYLFSLDNPYFFSYEGKNSDVKVVVFTYDWQEQLVNVAYSDMFSLNENSDEFEFLCQKLTEDGYMELSFKDYFEIVRSICTKKIDVNLSVLEDSVEEIFEVPNTYLKNLLSGNSSNLKGKNYFSYGDYWFRLEKFKIGKQTTLGWECSVTGMTDIKSKDCYLPIPKTMYGVPVLSVRECFANCSNLISAPYLPNTIIDMRKAFFNCFKLKYVEHLPSKVEKLDFAFAGCRSLQKCGWDAIPETVRTVRCTFACSGLEVAPDFSKAIHIKSMQETFRDTLVSDVSWSPNVKKAKLTYADCPYLVKVDNFPESIESLEQTFERCDGIREIFNLGTLKDLQVLDATFRECNNIVTVNSLPPNVISMQETFYGCRALSSVPQLPPSVTKVDGIFGDCKNLNRISDVKTDTDKHCITGIVSYGSYQCNFKFDYVDIGEIVKNESYNWDERFLKYIDTLCQKAIFEKVYFEPSSDDMLPLVIEKNINSLKSTVTYGFNDMEILKIINLFKPAEIKVSLS